ncbi:MAG: arginine--tRNA ligase, partial [Firmicutes bacterium HGW-Firmicutes-18]
MLKEAKKIVEKVLNESKIVCDLKYTVELPPSGIEADVSTNVAMLLSQKLKMNPKDIAEKIIEKSKKEKIVSDAKFQSGFINIIFADDFLFKKFQKNILSAIESNILKKRKILIEFVSANPTGPLHIGHGRGAAFGDSLARLFEFLGAKVEREYYINDVGNQMEILAQSVRSYIDKKPLQDIGYKGKYIEDIANEITNYKLQITNYK